MANWLAAGGIVMVPLLMFSVLTLALVAERSWFWLRLQRQQRPWITGVLRAYAEHPQRALILLKQCPDSPVARIFLAALSLEEATPDEFSLALESAAQAEVPQLKRFQTWFDTVVGVAPLLGLLGTVLGLMEALSSLRLGEGGNEAGVTLGVGEALTSTAAGLIVAMGALLCSTLFQGLYRRQRALIQETAGKLEILQRRHYRQTQAEGRRGRSPAQLWGEDPQPPGPWPPCPTTP